MSPVDGRRRAQSALLALLVLAAGCAPHYKELSTVSEVPTLERLQQASHAMPSDLLRLESVTAGGHPLEVAAERTGKIGAERTLVLIHGLMSDRTTWRFLVGELGAEYEILSLDLPGCGDSDRPDPGRAGRDTYSPTGMARTVLVALRDFSRRTGAGERITLVGHSLGGAVLMRALGDESLREPFSDVLERVDSAVLISPLDFSVEKVHPTFARIEALGGTKVRIAAWLRVLKNRASEIVLQQVVDPRLALEEEAQRFIRMLRQRSSRRAAREMIRQAVPFDPETRQPLWEEIESLVEDYENIHVPTLIVCGARDETLPVSMGYKLQAQIPGASLRILSETKHSPQIERPERTAAIVRGFLGVRGARWPRISQVAISEPPVAEATLPRVREPGEAASPSDSPGWTAGDQAQHGHEQRAADDRPHHRKRADGEHQGKFELTRQPRAQEGTDEPQGD